MDRCVEVRGAMELSLGVVSRVGRAFAHRWVDVPQEEGVVLGLSSRDLDSETADYRLHRTTADYA